MIIFVQKKGCLFPNGEANWQQNFDKKICVTPIKI